MNTLVYASGVDFDELCEEAEKAANMLLAAKKSLQSTDGIIIILGVASGSIS